MAVLILSARSKNRFSAADLMLDHNPHLRADSPFTAPMGEYPSNAIGAEEATRQILTEIQIR